MLLDIFNGIYTYYIILNMQIIKQIHLHICVVYENA